MKFSLFTGLTLAIGLLVNTADSSIMWYEKPQFLGYNPDQVQRNLRHEFYETGQSFNWEEVIDFMSNCRQGKDYFWKSKEEKKGSYVKDWTTFVETRTMSCWSLSCDYSPSSMHFDGGYYYDAQQGGWSEKTCEYDRFTNEEKKCYNSRGMGASCYHIKN